MSATPTWTCSGTLTSGTALTLTKSDGGLLVLAGTNTYTGGTEVSAGTLDFIGPAATPSEGILSVDPGGYVVLGGLVGASSPATDADATETAADASGTVATTSPVAEAALLAKFEASKTATLGGAALLTGSAVTGAAAVPEPGTLVLLLAAAAGLAIASRLRKRTAR